MRKHAGSKGRRIQSEAIRRAQEAGKREATEAGRRATRSFEQESVRNVSRDPENVSVEVPYRLRRVFALVIVGLVVGIILYALISNIGLWQSLKLPIPNTDSAVAPHSDPTSNPNTLIGIVSGHRGNDSGAVCQDGLTEAQVNYDIAVRVTGLLRAQGYTVEILNEFDERLKGYQARLLLSIHADSCTYVNDLATGFKVARVLDSKTPQEEDQLVSCLKTNYAQVTGLRFHANTVTFDMTKYHAFYEVDAHTPAAIIETGFLYLDRQILTRRPEAVAQGIYNGLMCYLNHGE